MENRVPMRMLVSEIVYRSTAKVLEGCHPSRIAAVAEPLADAVVALVSYQGKSSLKVESIKTESYLVWDLWSRILDEVEKEIPIVSTLNIICSQVSRSERTKSRSADYLTRLRRPMPDL